MTDAVASRERADTARGPVARLAGWGIGLGGVGVAAVLAVADGVDDVTAACIAGGSVLIGVVAAAVLELRARDRMRKGWLDRLHQLTDDLAGAVSSDDPARVVRDASERAVADLAPAPRTMDHEREAFVRSVADQCAQAQERIGLDRAQQRARADLELLARASPDLAASLDLDRVTETIKTLVVPELADECELLVATTARARPGGRDDAPEDGNGAVVPLEAHGRFVGELEVRRRDRPLTEEDLTTVRLLAEPAARALDHALRFSDEVHASTTLQDSLLPRAVLSIEGLEVATRYLAAVEGQVVGGDFYDVVRTPDGTAVVMVGDVQGKGIEAAALTSTARHTMRTAALQGATPAEMLRRVNEALLYADAERAVASGAPSVRFVTVAVVALTATPEGFDGVVASGGHPPPLIIRPDGQVEQVVADGPLLGVFDDAAYTECSIELRVSDILVLYTDGVTERRRQPELFDEAQLGRLVRNQLTVRRADVVAQLILDTVVDLSPREVRDDIALVVVRVTGARSS